MTLDSSFSPNILIVGCGGIGGVLAIRLLEKGAQVSIATTNAGVREVWTSTGPLLNGRQQRVRLPSSQVFEQPCDAAQTFDLVFVAVQPTQIEEVAGKLDARLKRQGRVVCLLNGLCEDRLAEHLGDERIIGAVVTWGARMPQPGHYRRTSSGGFLVGTLHGRTDQQLLSVIRLLEGVGPVRRTENLRGARLSKLTINCAISALGTIGGTTLGRLLVQRKVRELGLALMREAVAVAVASGVQLEPIAKVRLERLVARSPSTRPLTVATQHAALLALGSRYRKLRSSMLAAIERGRAPAIDFINGEIVRLGAQFRVPTPFNQAATETVWAIFRGELTPGNEAMSHLSRRSRELCELEKVEMSVA